jgi:TRAP-type C4-dicarboxylate transport system permease small subunit
MSKIKKFVRIIRGLMDALEVHGSTLFLFTIFITMFLQVVLRYLFNKPSPALFEVTQYAFPWGTLLGLPVRTKVSRSHPVQYPLRQIP